MKNSFGNNITVSIFGESHGKMIGAVLDGLAPGIKIDRDYINKKLAQRRPCGNISTKRVEADEFQIVSGEFQGYTTGTPLTVLIPNTEQKSSDYSSIFDIPRPGHADFAAECKYHGYQDKRGGGHFSGRITAATVAAGAIVEYALLSLGIKIGTHISSLAGIHDRNFSDLDADINYLSDAKFPVLDMEAAMKMTEKIEEAARMGDSVGGILESVITGLPAGVGEPYFDTLEGLISHALFSVPGIKGVSFGAGFGFADMYGSEANDAFETDGKSVYTKTNNNGGINGGISNGMPITVKSAVKPTPSIYKEQSSISLSKMTNEKTAISGRHDPAIIHRARAVVDATLAIAVGDALVTRFGTDYLKNGGK